MTRRKVAEWWEVWWCKPGEPRIRVMCGYGKPKNECVPWREGVTKAEAMAYLERNRFYRAVRVTRYRRRVPQAETGEPK